MKIAVKNCGRQCRSFFYAFISIPFLKVKRISSRLYRGMNKDRLLKGFRSSIFISDSNGGYISYYAYNKCLSETALRLFGKKVTSHFMRHTHVALMAEQGVPLDVISRRLGHADSKITRDIYFHVTKKMKEQDFKKSSPQKYYSLPHICSIFTF